MLLGQLSQQEIICKSVSGVHEKVLSENKCVSRAMHEMTPSVVLAAGSKRWADFPAG